MLYMLSPTGQCLAIHLSLSAHPKRRKDHVYAMPYNLIPFNYNLRATFESRYTYSPFCKPASLASSPQAAHETDLCTEAGGKLGSKKRQNGNTAGTLQSVHTRLSVPTESTRTAMKPELALQK